MENKKRKIDKERRVFKERWCEKYLCIEADGKPLCLICNQSVSVIKEYNIRRHYESKHASKYSKYSGVIRCEIFESLKKGLYSAQLLSPKKKFANNASTRSSYKITHLLARQGKPFSDGELVKECMLQAAEELCPKQANLFKSINLSESTIASQVEDIKFNLAYQIAEKAKQFKYYSLAFYEFANFSKSEQLLVFIRGVGTDFEITQELISLHSLHRTTTAQDIFNDVKKTLTDYQLQLENLYSVTTNGDQSRNGFINGLITEITRNYDTCQLNMPLFFHCTIHQQALVSNCLDMSCVLKPVISVVNFIRSHALNHHLLLEFLKELHCEVYDLTYYTSVRWINCGKILTHFFNLRHEIAEFLMVKNQGEPLLSDDIWLWKLAFFADLTGHMNQFILCLQEETYLVCDLFTHVTSFTTKLKLLEEQLTVSNFSQFPFCVMLRFSSKTDFPSVFATNILSELKNELETHFGDFKKIAENIKFFQNPFVNKVASIENTLQVEVTNLKYNKILESKYKESTLLEFYQSLPAEDYPNLRNFACRFLSMFNATDLCEQAFSKLKHIKSCHQEKLSDEHLKSLLFIGTTKLYPDFNDILRG